MSYSIIGFGAVGQALASMFARKGLEVSVASTRAPEAIVETARAIGPSVTATRLDDALAADIILLAVPFWAHRDVAAALPDWHGKTVIDVTNAFGVPVAELGGLASSEVIARAMPGARLAKAFNHLSAAVLRQDPAVQGGRRVAFVAGDDGAVAAVAAVVERLGFAPVALGNLSDGGRLVQASDRQWAPLIFKDLFTKES